VRIDAEQLSLAIVAYFGYGTDMIPRDNSHRLVEMFGNEQAQILERIVLSLRDEIFGISVDWKTHTLAQGSDLAILEMKRRHPELSNDAIAALGWFFAWAWR
jgi:hypothetical protein